jgi:hypothetical protein
MTLRVASAAMALAAGILGSAAATSPVALADPPYKNCSQAHADGRYNIPRGDPAYQPKLDRDDDGIACEG